MVNKRSLWFSEPGSRAGIFYLNVATASSRSGGRRAGASCEDTGCSLLSAGGAPARAPDSMAVRWPQVPRVVASQGKCSPEHNRKHDSPGLNS